MPTIDVTKTTEALDAAIKAVTRRDLNGALVTLRTYVAETLADRRDRLRSSMDEEVRVCGDGVQPCVVGVKV